jgi:hypothetical protein
MTIFRITVSLSPEVSSSAEIAHSQAMLPKIVIQGKQPVSLNHDVGDLVGDEPQSQHRIAVTIRPVAVVRVAAVADVGFGPTKALRELKTPNPLRTGGFVLLAA